MVEEEVEVVAEVVVLDRIIMGDIRMEIVTETGAVHLQGAILLVGGLVAYSAVYSVVFSVLFFARMVHVKDVADVVNKKETVHIIKIHTEVMKELMITLMKDKARGRVRVTGLTINITTQTSTPTVLNKIT